MNITNLSEKEREELDAKLADISNREDIRHSDLEHEETAAATQV
jgi:hypothetical protein